MTHDVELFVTRDRLVRNPFRKSRESKVGNILATSLKPPKHMLLVLAC